MAKQKYYSIFSLLEQKATYNMLLGERSNGKSYSVKYMSLWVAFNELDYYEHFINKKDIKLERYQFGYLRRWKDEIKTRDVELYFDDMPISEITNNEYDSVTCYRNDIYFSKYTEDGKKERGKKIGSCFAINGATHYKSLSFPKIANIIFEEFLTNDGYLAHEVDSLTSIISTIARRDFVQIFMIGNTINRMCPYMEDWQLTHVKNQKIGTIEIYNQHTDQIDDNENEVVVKIAVEYCANSGNNTKVFFGNKAKTITSGVWDTNIYPHLEKNLNEYKKYYMILYKYNSFSFVINLLVNENNEPFLYIYPSTKVNKNIKRIVTTDFSTSKLTSNYLTPLTKYDILVLDLIKQQKIVYSDNLTGTEFNQIKKERGIY